MYTPDLEALHVLVRGGLARLDRLLRDAGGLGALALEVALALQRRFRGLLPIFGKFLAKCCSFSAVSAPIFASKYAFFSIFQNLQDYLADFFKN